MLSEDKLVRVNELAKKKKENGLTENEIEEQKNLRNEYLANLRNGFRKQVEGLKIIDENGNDVTPEKLKLIQKEKHLHNRHLENKEEL